MALEGVHQGLELLLGFADGGGKLCLELPLGDVVGELGLKFGFTERVKMLFQPGELLARDFGGIVSGQFGQ